jgi:hypothetical protein
VHATTRADLAQVTENNFEYRFDAQTSSTSNASSASALQQTTPVAAPANATELFALVDRARAIMKGDEGACVRARVVGVS